jgi:hypothetical protein
MLQIRQKVANSNADYQFKFLSGRGVKEEEANGI